MPVDVAACRTRRLARVLILGSTILGWASVAPGQEDVEARLARLEAANRQLAEQNAALQKQLQATNARFEQVMGRLESATAPPPVPAASLPGPVLVNPTPAPGVVAPPAPASPSLSKFVVGDFDESNGQYVLVRPRDKNATPYELRVDVWNQFRYTNFSRAKTDWVNSAGVVLPVRNINSFEIMRNWILFAGYAFDPRLQYYLTFFSSTAFNDTTVLGWVNYAFSKSLDVRVGNWLIPGVREWYNSYRYTLGADRTMATTYFRPNISPGIWAQGEPVKGLNYVVMLADAFNRFNQTANRVGTNLTLSSSVWWEPLGEFGPGPSDIEDHDTFTPRLGTSFTFGRQTAQRTPSTPGNPEDTILRLSDGTPLFEPNALGPGVSLEAANVQLWALDAGFKFRGLSVTGEYFLRWFDDFRPLNKAPEFSSIFTHGAYVQGGYFVMPKYLQLFARHSFVSGGYGYGDEWGGGINWFVKGTRNWRITGEVLKVNGSPADNILTGYRAGESGTLFQVQMFADF